MNRLEIERERASIAETDSRSLTESQVSRVERPLLSVVIPAYNERARIGKTLYTYSEVLRNIPHEILVAVDGSRDDTADTARAMSSDVPSLEVVEHSHRLGKGGGILAGVRRARGTWIVIVDADGSLPPEELARMVGLASSGEDDAVIATRYRDRNRIVEDYGFLRWFASRAFNVLVRSLYRLPFQDTQCGAKIVRRSAVEAVVPQIRLRRYAFDVEFLWRLHDGGYRIAEVPIRWEHRDGSKIRILSVSWYMFFDLLRLLVSH